jgi:hypothetical protein
MTEMTERERRWQGDNGDSRKRTMITEDDERNK